MLARKLPSFIIRKLSLHNLIIAVVYLTLIILMGFTVSQVVSMLVESNEQSTTITIDRFTEVSASDKKAKNVKDVTDLYLFGKSTLTRNKIEKAVDTKLNLTLRGIYYQKSGDASMAIIQNNANKVEEHYVIGDSVFQFAVLEQVHVDRVILLHNGRYETLRLPRKSLDLKSVPDAEVVASKTIQAFRNGLLTGNMEKYIFHIDYDTVYDDDGFLGFKIFGDSEQGKEILRKMGLADGDIVTEVDGVVLATDRNAMKVVKNLRTVKKAVIGIDRGGVTIYLNLDFTR